MEGDEPGIKLKYYKIYKPKILMLVGHVLLSKEMKKTVVFCLQTKSRDSLAKGEGKIK